MANARRLIRFGCWGAAAFFLVALGIRDLQLDRVIPAGLDTLRNRPTAYLSAIGPPVRVDASSGDIFVIGEPVYMTLRVPRWFDRVIVEFRYDHSDLPLRVGVRTHPVRWEYAVKTVTGGERHPDVDIVEDGPVQTMRVPFTLERSWQVERNAYQFILSIPGASPGRPFIVHAWRMTAERDPICVGSWCV